MTLVQYALTLACVIAIAAGQVMFKLSARSVAGSSALHELLFSPILIAALAVYAVATVAWISQLRYVDLSRAYPLMALSFVIVPLASMAILGETVAPRYWAGVALIVGGIVLTVL